MRRGGSRGSHTPPRGAPNIEIRQQIASAQRELVELASDGAQAWGLYWLSLSGHAEPSTDRDTLYWLCRNDAAPSACSALPKDRLPTALRLDAGSPEVYCLDLATATAPQRAVVLRRDFTRLALSGLSHYGVKNIEGRIPCGQVCVLEGLAVLVGVATELGDTALAEDARGGARNNPAVSVERSDVNSRRYSIDRSNIIPWFTMSTSRMRFFVQDRCRPACAEIGAIAACLILQRRS